MNLQHCTLTGVDERTDLDSLVQLSAEFPIVEWGFLFSPKRQGQPGRYPAIRTLMRCLQELPMSVPVALHICGDGVHCLLDGWMTERTLLGLVQARGGRIQFNFNQRRAPVDLGKLAGFMASHPRTTFITQHNDANVDVWSFLAERGIANHAVLFDESGGRGVARQDWPSPLPVSCGYAGGLGPDNLRTELPRIAAAAAWQSSWIDMEGKLRRQAGVASEDGQGGCDWFDLEACRQCLLAVSDALSGVQDAHGIR